MDRINQGNNKNNDFLLKLFGKYPEVWKDKKKFKALLMDLLPDDKLRRNLIYICVEEQIPDDLVRKSSIDAIDIGRFKKRLINACGCKDDLASEIIMMWINAICSSIINNNQKCDTNETILNLTYIKKIRDKNYAWIVDNYRKLTDFGIKTIDRLSLGLMIFLGFENVEQNFNRAYEWLRAYVDDYDNGLVSISEEYSIYQIKICLSICCLYISEDKTVLLTDRKYKREEAHKLWDELIEYDPANLDNDDSINDYYEYIYQIGLSFYSGNVNFDDHELSILIDYEYAYRAFIKAEQGGVSQAITALAWLYEGGKYVEKSIYMAAALYLRAAFENDEDAVKWVQNFFIDDLSWDSISEEYDKPLSDILKRPCSRVIQDYLDLYSLSDFRKLKVKEIIERRDLKKGYLLEFLIELKQYVDSNCINYLIGLSVPEDYFQDCIDSKDIIPVKQYFKAVDYVKPGNLEYDIWFNWNRKTFELAESEELLSTVELIHCYNYGFGIKQDTEKAIQLFLSNIQDYEGLGSDTLIEIAIRLVYQIHNDGLDISLRPAYISSAKKLLTQVIFRVDSYHLLAKRIQDLLCNAEKKKQVTAENVFLLMSDLYEYDLDKNRYWISLIPKVRSYKSELTGDCFKRLLRNYYYSFNREIISDCIDCLQNGADISGDILWLSDRYGGRYLTPLLLLVESNNFKECRVDGCTKNAIYCYVSLYSDSITVRNDYLNEMVEKSIYLEDSACCKYYRTHFLKMNGIPKDEELFDNLIACFAMECKIAGNYTTVMPYVIKYCKDEINWIIRRKMAERGVEQAFVDLFNHLVSKRELDSYVEMIELADECIQSEGREEFIFGIISKIKREIDEGIADFALWYKYAGEHGDKIQECKYAKLLLYSNDFQDVKKGCVLLSEENNIGLLKGHIRKFLEAGNVNQVMFMSDALIMLDTFENSILDNPLWFVDCLSKNNIWFYSELEDIKGEQLFKLIDEDEKKFLGAMCILADHGLNICFLEEYIHSNFDRFEILNPNYSHYVLLD